MTDTTTELKKGSYFAPGGSFEKDRVPLESTNSKDKVEKCLEEKALTSEEIKKYATDNQLTDLTECSYVGNYEFLVYKHTGNNMLYFLRRTNPEEEEARYSLQMCVPAANHQPH